MADPQSWDDFVRQSAPAGPASWDDFASQSGKSKQGDFSRGAETAFKQTPALLKGLVGLGGATDIEVNLETSPIPFPNNSYDCVLCLDVLEHLDSIHTVFDELGRVSNRYIIISLPNPYRDFIGMLLRQGDPAINFKYYGLPAQRPDDRHKWFFSNSNAELFIRGRAEKNNLRIVQIDSEGSGWPKTISSALKRSALCIAALGLSIPASDLYRKTLWAVLEKPL